MKVTYTAQGLYDHIKSFNSIKCFSGKSEYNFTMITFASSRLKFNQKEIPPYMIAEFHDNSGITGACCCLAGNIFECEVTVKDDSEKLIVKSDIGKTLMSVILEK